jgi:hypothetical protein
MGHKQMSKDKFFILHAESNLSRPDCNLLVKP